MLQIIQYKHTGLQSEAHWIKIAASTSVFILILF